MRSLRWVNENHAKLCPSPQWAEHMQADVLPWVTAGVDLGDELVEVGPGPGATTQWLHQRVKRLVAVEHDEEAAAKLRADYAGTNVEVVHADATAMTFPDNSFDSAGSFTMLHHVPTPALQNQLLSEVLRVLRPGGVLIGSDSVASDDLHRFHEGDTYNPVDPGWFLGRLLTLGYTRVTVRMDDSVMFIAHKPAGPEEPGRRSFT
jgi:SAM-dependent methyltransferase